MADYDWKKIMTTAGTALALIVLAAEVWYVAKSRLSQPPPQRPPEIIDERCVKSDLLAIAQAEKKYIASHGSYASLDRLKQEGLIAFSGWRCGGYVYEVEIDDGDHFRITARPTDVTNAIWPMFSIDETMKLWEFAGGVFD